MSKKPVAKVLSTYELMQKFPDEQSAIDYITGILWQNGVVCPYCKGKKVKDRIDEFVFRLNEGNCKIDTVNRLEALVRGTAGKRLTYKMLVHGI